MRKASPILRGALTNGHDWIFLLIKLNDDDDGASYKQSSVIRLKPSKSGQVTITEPWPDLIAAIFLHWIEKSLQTLEVMIGSNWSTKCSEMFLLPLSPRHVE